MNDIRATAISVRQYLTYAYGAVLILIGLDKLFQTDIIANWAGYVGPLAQSIIPLTPSTFVMVLGAAEIVVGILFFTRYVRLACYIAIAVLALIIVDLLNLGLFDIAARDALIALGAFCAAMIAGAEGFLLTGRRGAAA